MLQPKCFLNGQTVSETPSLKAFLMTELRGLHPNISETLQNQQCNSKSECFHSDFEFGCLEQLWTILSSDVFRQQSIRLFWAFPCFYFLPPYIKGTLLLHFPLNIGFSHKCRCQNCPTWTQSQGTLAWNLWEILTKGVTLEDQRVLGTWCGAVVPSRTHF